MTLRRLFLPALFSPFLVCSGLDELSNSEAFLAASLAALKTPKMQNAPIQVSGAITHATGLQEDYGARAIVAIPDKKIMQLNLGAPPESAQPLCRLWVKGYHLTHDGKVIASEKAANLEVAAEGENHKVTVWLLALRKNTQGGAEIIVCADQPEPVLALPAVALSDPAPANDDAPVELSAEGDKLTVTILGSHRIELGLQEKS